MPSSLLRKDRDSFFILHSPQDGLPPALRFFYFFLHYHPPSKAHQTTRWTLTNTHPASLVYLETSETTTLHHQRPGSKGKERGYLILLVSEHSGIPR